MTSGTGRVRIATLPEVVKNQIAAGEVIERPASLVKELIENALDAGAQHLLVELEAGGVQLVRVTDDGHGIDPADLELAFASHATSKLSDPSDLEHIGTLGFRGEALASIGSVARCRLFSRARGEPLGRSLENHGGRIGAPREAGGPIGTSVEVRDLFFNTPARRRFLRTLATELGRCLDLVQRAALAHPGVGFVVTHDGRRVYDVEPSMDLAARVRRTFGTDLAEALVPVEGRDGDTRLVGYLAPPQFARGDSTRQMWFLNGRPLRDKVLTRCLKDAYRGFLLDGRQPVAFLSLSMDPAKVDVNVHPAKSEVRFRDQRRMFGFLVGVLREALRASDMATPGERVVEIAQRRQARHGTLVPMPRQGHLPDPLRHRPGSPDDLSVHERPAALARPAAEPAATLDPPTLDPGDRPDDLRGPYLQVGKTYLVRALPDGFEVVDQHALHERLTFEALMADATAGRVEVQARLVPELIELERPQAEQLEEHFEALARVGIRLTRFGPTTIAVNGLPARLRGEPEAVVRGALTAIERSGSSPSVREVLEDVLHSAACRSSVMAGDVLEPAEIRSLLERARQLEHDQTCPHGRPTRVRFTLSDLEKAFQRR